MRVTPVKTKRVRAGDELLELVDTACQAITDNSVVAISSKIVALCENRVEPLTKNRDNLIAKHSDKYLPPENSSYGHHFTVTDNTLIASAGIDESNSGNQYVLWPKDSQATANQIRLHLTERFGLKNVGVIIVDSTCQPLRRGTTGIALAHSGFLAVRDYRGQPDLFDRPFGVSVANISGGLAAAAVLSMGEGSEQTPLAVVSDVPFVKFQARDPSSDELEFLHLSVEDDLFAPFLANVGWLG